MSVRTLVPIHCRCNKHGQLAGERPTNARMLHTFASLCFRGLEDVHDDRERVEGDGLVATEELPHCVTQRSELLHFRMLGWMRGRRLLLLVSWLQGLHACAHIGSHLLAWFNLKMSKFKLHYVRHTALLRWHLHVLYSPQIHI